MAPGGAGDRVPIAVGVILDADRNRVLLTRRPDHLHQGGKWEFPGGKQEPGESMAEALRRELLEELNLQVVAARPFLRIAHDYPDLRVDLHVWLVTEWRGEALGMEGQTHEWVGLNTLHERRLPDANRLIVTTLQLPQLYLITPDLDVYGEEFFSRARTIVAAGVRLLQFRSRSLPAGKRAAVLRRLAALCREYGTTLIINGSAEELRDSGAGGLHLSAARHLDMRSRPLPRPLLLGASCHNVEELSHAGQIDADFAVLGPVAATGSHPARAPLGWPRFAQLLEQQRRIPVYAIGGIGPGDLPAARQAGAWGAAVISAIWSAADPAAAAAACVESAARLNGACLRLPAQASPAPKRYR